MKEVGISIVYRAGKENANADALSRNPVGPTPRNAELEGVQVASVQTGELTIQELLEASPETESQPFQFDPAKEQSGLSSQVNPFQFDPAKEQSGLSSQLNPFQFDFAKEQHKERPRTLSFVCCWQITRQLAEGPQSSGAGSTFLYH